MEHFMLQVPPPLIKLQQKAHVFQPYQLGKEEFSTEIKGKLRITGNFGDDLESKNSLGGLYFQYFSFYCDFFHLLNFSPLPPVLYLATFVSFYDYFFSMLLRLSIILFPPSSIIEDVVWYRFYSGHSVFEDKNNSTLWQRQLKI